jgi:hypothetical protein
MEKTMAMGGRPKSCAKCNAPVRDKVALFIPGLNNSGGCNLCADCMDLYVEQQIAESRRKGADPRDISFRGIVGYAKKNYIAHHRKTKPRAVKQTDIVAALKGGTITVEELLAAIKAGTE